MAKIFSFSNQKGGVGKTTSCINIASFLALKGFSVLVVDFDPQANSSSSLGVFDRKITKSCYEVLCSDLDINIAIIDTEIENLKLLPSSINLAGAELELAGLLLGRERVLQEKLEQIKFDFDLIFIDCPPSLSLLTINALTASDSVIIPIQCEFFALEGLSQIMNTIKLVKKFLNDKICVDGVILTMFDSRSNLSKEVTLEIDKYFGKKVFSTKIPRNVRLAESPSFGKPICTYDKKCAGAIAYNALADEFINKIL